MRHGHGGIGDGAVARIAGMRKARLNDGAALVAALLGALESVGKHHADAEIQLETRRKRLEDLRLELARSFEHEGRLTDLLVRQRELLKQLDLDKDEAGSAKVDADEARQAA